MSERRPVCPACSCLCDGGDCDVGNTWFAGRKAAEQTSPEFDAAEVRKLLEEANLPLITGIGNLTTQDQQAAAKVADKFFAGIDSGWSDINRGSMAAFERYGKVTATLGEIANRSDLIVCWFCDPASNDPCFIKRFVRNSDKPKKRLIVIDDTKSATSKIADEFIQLDAGDATDFVQQIRISLEGDESPQSDFTRQLVNAAYGCVVLGKPSTESTRINLLTDQWYQLVRSLNDHTRFVITSLRNDCNGQSVNYVLASISGFSNAVRFTQNGPIHNGTEYSTINTIARRECDLLVACDVGVEEPFESRLDDETILWLKTIPVVVVSDLPANQYQTATLHIEAGTPGWTTAGDFMRSDGVLIPMPAASGVEINTVADLFQQLLS